MFETVFFSKVKFYEESEDKKHFHTTKYTQKAELQLIFGSDTSQRMIWQPKTINSKLTDPPLRFRVPRRRSFDTRKRELIREEIQFL